MSQTVFDIDEFRSWLKDFYTGLLRDSDPYGCFTWREQVAPNLLYINDIIWIKWSFDDLNPDEEERKSWIETINSFQVPEGGFYQNPPFETHSWQHATWRALVSLNMLGGKPRYPLTFLEPLKDITTCRQWVASHKSRLTLIPHHRYALGAFVISSGVSEEWKEAYFKEIASMQNPKTGFWPLTTGEDSLSPTFMFSVLHIAFGRETPNMSKILDTTLAIQEANGLFNKEDTLTFHDMDAVFLLNYISDRFSYRREEALEALRKMTSSIQRLWENDRERVFLYNPHQILAICGILSVLKECLPEIIRGETTCRFPYAEKRFLHCP